MRRFLIYWLPFLAYAGLIFYGSSRTLPAIPIAVPNIDKAAHFLEYGLFAGLAGRAFYRTAIKRVWFLTLLVSVLYAFSDEWHQLYVPGRQMDPFDFLFDALGALAVTMWWQWRAGRKAAEAPVSGK